jgi:hypothetical protein
VRDRQVQQARKAGVEVVAAQAVQPPGALVALADDSGLPQHPEVATLSRLADRQRERRAGQLTTGTSPGQPGHDRQPYRVAQRPAQRHADVLSTFYVVIYLGVSLPVVGVGFLTTVVGLLPAVQWFAAVAAVLSLAALTFLFRSMSVPVSTVSGEHAPPKAR